MPFPFYFLLAFIDVAYLYPYYKAMKVIDTSIVSALFSLGQITIPIMTYLFLDERLRESQYAGFLLIIAASIVLSINDFKMPKLNRAFLLYGLCFSAAGILCRFAKIYL